MPYYYIYATVQGTICLGAYRGDDAEAAIEAAKSELHPEQALLTGPLLEATIIEYTAEED
jgi:hypothetical protein